MSALLICSISEAQFCGTVPMQQQILRQHPELADKIKEYNDKLEKDISEKIKVMDLSKLERTTASGDTTIIIPVVVHVIHDYGSENVPDNKITAMLNNLNDFYQLRNDTSVVIPIFKKYVGKMNYIFKFATKDPQGNSTKGITRHYSYLSYGKDNQAKLDEWNPRSYMNIWVENYVGLAAESGGVVAAYAIFPSEGAAIPYWDGLMCASPFLTITGNDEGATIPHEVGHYFNLYHTWGNTNTPLKGCGGDDLVDDTPPTQGDFGTCNVYDTICATGNYKMYPSSVPGVDSLVDYPDTCNVSNIMNYASCKNMFTIGQTVRARAAAYSDVGGRDSLWTTFNLTRTGALQPVPDLAPVADFSVANPTFSSISQTAAVSHYMCSSQTFRFVDQSWNDTIATRSWTFSNGATNATSTDPIVNNKFSQTGWVSISLTVTSNAGTNTITKDSLVYVADPTGIPAEGYYEEFSPSADLNKWPIFNYYSDAPYKWSYNNQTGFYDKNCVTYTAYDPRTYPSFYIGAPQGDFADLFSPALDLTSMATNNNANLNFMYAGTSRTGNSIYMTDTLDVSYSTDCGTTWKPLKSLTKKDIDNNGSLGIPYQPLSQTEWSLQSIVLPSIAKTNNTFFRFRYRPEGGGENNGIPTSNNFYMDRFNVSIFPAGVNTLVPDNKGIAVAPNPTNGNAYVIIKENSNAPAQIIVTDVTGKTIYNTHQQVGGSISRIEIPATVISAKGIYMVQVITPDQTHTEKLVVY